MSDSKKINLDAAAAIAEAFKDKKHLEEVSGLLKKFCDGEPINKNPLTEIPTPEMSLYYINGYYFETKRDAESYCRSKGTSISDICVVSYLRKCANRSDVIMKKYRNQKIMLYTAVDEDGYGIYNNERSIYRGEFVWEYDYGDLRGMYSAFRDRGITFENDIYAKIDERYQHILNYCRENRLFNMGEE